MQLSVKCDAAVGPDEQSGILDTTFQSTIQCDVDASVLDEASGFQDTTFQSFDDDDDFDITTDLLDAYDREVECICTGS